MTGIEPAPSTAATGLSPAATGIVCMIVGTLLLTTQDAMAKWLTAHYHVGEILFYRGIWAYLPIAVFVWRAGGLRALRSRRPGVNIVRALINLSAGLLIISAFRLMPLADVLAIAFASPLILTALSVPLLGEAVGWRRWSAVVVGFCGVLLMTRPTGAGLDLVILLPLGTAVLLALRDILTRRLGAFDPPTTILFYTISASVLGGAATLPFGTSFPTPGHWVVFAASGIINGIAHFLTIKAFQLAQAATVAPLRYLSLVWAVFVGFIIWGDLPNVWIVAGATLVVGSGLYILQREARLARARR